MVKVDTDLLSRGLYLPNTSRDVIWSSQLFLNFDYNDADDWLREGQGCEELENYF